MSSLTSPKRLVIATVPKSSIKNSSGVTTIRLPEIEGKSTRPSNRSGQRPLKVALPRHDTKAEKRIFIHVAPEIDIKQEDDEVIFDDEVKSNGPVRKRQRLDHLSFEQKLLRRKLKNRVAAQSARDKKKAKMDDLEIIVKSLEKQQTHLSDQNKLLHKGIKELQAENKELKEELKKRFTAPACAECSKRKAADDMDTRSSSFPASPSIVRDKVVSTPIRSAEGTGSENGLISHNAWGNVGMDSDRNSMSDADCLSIFNQLQAELLSSFCKPATCEEEVPRQMVGESSERMEPSGWDDPTQIECATEIVITSKSDHAYSRKSIDAPTVVNTPVITPSLNSIPPMDTEVTVSPLDTEVTVSPSGITPVLDTGFCNVSVSPCTSPDLSVCPAPAVDMLPSDILDLDSIFEESLNIPNLLEYSMEEGQMIEEGIVIENQPDFKGEDFSNCESDSDSTSLYEDAYFPVISQSEVNKSILDSVIPFSKPEDMSSSSPVSPMHSDAGYESYGSPSSDLSLSDSLAQNLDDLFPILV